MRTGARIWVVAFVLVLATVGFGQLESWPFTSWYMFSYVEAPVARVARAVAVAPSGAERALGSDVLPAGLQSHRLLQRFASATPSERGALCATLIAAGRRSGAVASVRIEERRWRVLDRRGDRPAHIRTTTIAECR